MHRVCSLLPWPASERWFLHLCILRDKQQKLEKRRRREGKGLQICVCTSDSQDSRAHTVWSSSLGSVGRGVGRSGCGALMGLLQGHGPSAGCNVMRAVRTSPECPALALRPLLVGVCILPIWPPHPHLFLWPRPPPTTHTHLLEEVVFCVLQMSFYLNDLLASAFAKNLISDYPGLLTVMHVCVFILMYMYIPMSSEKSVVFTHNSSNWRWCHHTVVRFGKDGPWKVRGFLWHPFNHSYVGELDSTFLFIKSFNVTGNCNI